MGDTRNQESATDLELRSRVKTWALFTIVDVNDRSVWRRIGSAFSNRDGSFNLYLEALPVNGRLHMREV